MEKITLHVEGMSCGHCVKAVEGSVGKLQGVSNVKVNLEGGTVEVDFNNQQVSVDEIKESIDDQGYEVKS
ncbi:copper chaperone CopZ [Bacillus sp. FJAT-49732]|uniref:Copper chaperone CopZ n=1 Tax=Lederbergia citrisecunda TaxID=2833583 RepID=A0A942YM58_9BACI|nr:copper chaperone CopZ [Lederbergia citrisecunda]MBS4200345.1 copper chaperone CopZ [Lederbergia citrisecunda]